MVFKFAFALVFVAAANAGYAPSTYAYHSGPISVHSAPVAVGHKVITRTEDYDPHPQYKYSYDVEDKLTGDYKSQVEERDGGVVHGEYSLIDADGYKRTVKYTADDHNGFNAVVERKPLVEKHAHYTGLNVVKTAVPVAHYLAPTVIKSHYTAPVKHTSYDVPTYYNYHQH